MNKEEFIGKLQMTYFGDRNAFNEIVSEYDRLNNIIDELEKWLIEQADKSWEDYYNAIDDVLDKLNELKSNH